MSGTLFIITVPQIKYENVLKQDQTELIVIDKNRHFVKEEKVKKLLRKISRESYAKIDHDNLVLSKCKSTEFLHSTPDVPSMVKSNSENAISGKEGSYIKVSWNDVKHNLKSRRNKLTINRSGGVDILSAFHWNTPLETMLSEILTRVNVKNSSWSSTNDDNFWQVTFTMESGNLAEELLQVLRTFGIGSKFKSSVCMLPCALYYKSHCDITGKSNTSMGNNKLKTTAWNRFSSSVRARNNLAQILHDVRTEAALTFDWLFLLIVAAFVAAIGLVENSTVFLVASMLISPLMSPITASTLGTAVRDRSLQLMGVAHELFGLFLALVIGFIFGLVICAVDEHYGVGEWPTNEILSRCEVRSLWVGVLVAIPSGAAVALAILGEYTSSLVGVAISASLLPPAVNAGLLWAMSLVHLVYNDDEKHWNGVIKDPVYSSDQPTELAILGLMSLCLTLVNIVSIFLAGVAVYKIKEVCPLERKNMSWWRENRMAEQSRRQYNNFDNWNTYKYRRWYFPTNISHVTPHNKYNIQNDTVTYRKPTQYRERLNTQDIQSWCYENENNSETNTTNLQMKPNTNANQNEQQTGTEDYNRDKTENDFVELENLENMTQNINNQRSMGDQSDHTTNYSGEDSLNDLKFETFSHNGNTPVERNTSFSTIDPSTNVTVAPTKNGILLVSKSFKV